jgi:uncharacterized protein (DUF433 family)
MELDRITFDPNVMAGQACVRGMRITVSLVINLVANGMTAREIIEEYPDLEEEDIKQCLYYGSLIAKEEYHILTK